jgi:hypothetical protein
MAKQLDPTTFMDHIMGQYKQSEGYKGRQDDLMKQMASVAGQGGYAGTPYAQQQYGEQANKLMVTTSSNTSRMRWGFTTRVLSGEQGFL